MQRTTLTHLRKLKLNGEKIAVLTGYDASFARLLDEAGVDIILVGDSLGMVVQGHDTTLPVTVEQMVYHCQAVAKGSARAMIIADLPFMSYATPEKAFNTAAKLMAEGHAQMVKLEGGFWLVDTVRLLTERGIPVCAHLGLTPQSVHQLGGYRQQGRTDEEAKRLRKEALALQAAGASLLVLECIPSDLSTHITHLLHIPTIGIGAGPACDGQVLVLYDMLGISPRSPSFSKNFLLGQDSIQSAITHFVKSVKAGNFPS